MAFYQTDVVIIGGGIAGLSLAAALGRRAIVLEQESHPGMHATGRSAAVFSATYGNETVRRLSGATLPFLRHPERGFADHPLLTRRGVMYIARDDQLETLDAFAGRSGVAAATIRLGEADIRARLPIIRQGYCREGLLEPDASDIDVHALQSGYLKKLRANGGRFLADTKAIRAERLKGAWQVEAPGITLRAPIIVNAAGAWADEIASMAGARPIGIEPRRRTAALVDPPQDARLAEWPMTVDIDEQFYLKPDAGRVLVSPGDETLTSPCDAYPEELDVAIAIDRVLTATTLDVKRVHRSWAGLRTFAPDRSPVIGFDPGCEGFFWLAGQGGYGIQTCQAAALAAAALIEDKSLPDALAAEGLTIEALSPARFSLSANLGRPDRGEAAGSPAAKQGDANRPS